MGRGRSIMNNEEDSGERKASNRKGRLFRGKNSRRGPSIGG